MAARRLEDAHGADHVDVRVEARILHRARDRRLGREVEADVRARRVEHAVGVGADVALVQRCVGQDVFPLPGGEVVEHVHLVAAGDERVHQVRADEARAAGHDRPHLSIS